MRRRQIELQIAEYYEGVSGFISWATSRQSTIDKHELQNKRQVADEMNAQFQQLASDAQQNSDQGHEARQILSYILLSNGRPFMAGSSHESDDTNAQANPPVQSDRTWAVQAAAKALLDVSKSADPSVKQDAANLLVVCLTGQPTMSRDIREQVLSAFVNLHPGETGVADHQRTCRTGHFFGAGARTRQLPQE